MAPTRGKRSSIRARAVKAKTSESQGNDAPRSQLDTSQDQLLSQLQQSSDPTGPVQRKRDGDDDGDDAVDWRLSKHDKRTIKHNVFLAKVRDSSIQKKKPLKRRRPGNKLKADIGGLADALPAVEGGSDGHQDDDEWEGVSDDDGDDNEHHMAVDGKRKRKRTDEAGKMVMTSLRRRPGALKRKKKMEDAEMDRFRRNLAQMAAKSGDKPAVAAFGDRWASLRSFIGTTMQQDKAFTGD